MRALLCCLLLAVAPAAARAETAEAPLTAQQMLAAMDRIRNPGQPFRLANTLIEYVGGKPHDRVALVVFSKQDATAQYDTLVRYVDPPRDAGKMVLMDGSKMYFYDPASKASVRLSPQQRLIGQASNGDVVTVNFARDYKAAITGAESISDADRKPRECWHLDLAAADEDAVYARIEFWLEKDSYQPIKGKFYSDSGRMLKIAYYHKVEQQLGGARPTETIIIDAVDPNLVTTMSFADYRFQEIPDSWFQRDFLPHLKLD
jgi:outer membrane lipoprotein-sorting protein